MGSKEAKKSEGNKVAVEEKNDDFKNTSPIRKNDALKIAHGRYEFIIENLEVTIFDYIIKTNTVFFIKNQKNVFKFPHRFKGGIEALIELNIIHPRSVEKTREICKKIKAGAQEIKETIVFVDSEGNERIQAVFIKNIFDENKNPIQAIGSLRDITEKKVQEKKQKEEQHFFEAMFPKTATRYEINITKDKFITENKKWPSYLGISEEDSYSEIVKKCEKKLIHPEDISEFRQKLWRINILKAFYAGTNQIYYEYRYLNEDKIYTWISLTLYLLKDPSTQEVKAFTYVNNIDKEKRKELALIYKSEHDGLTELYNKTTAENFIKTYLLSKEGMNGSHALFIIDIDYFKRINDNLGHIVGDVLLSEIAKKIKSIFRESDIVGRSGGDEFLVLMKNVNGNAVVASKANQLCKTTREFYADTGEKIGISVSSGIAVFPQDGKDFDCLYKNADTALYVSKEQGRDQFTWYSKSMGNETEIRGKEIDINDYIEAQPFEGNVENYTFRLLYESTDKVKGIFSALEIIGKHYHMSRVYIYEKTKNGLKNTFQWLNKEVRSHNTSLEERLNLEDYPENFNKDGIYFLEDFSKSSKEEKFNFYGLEIQSTLQFSIIKDKEFKGFVGFDHCGFSRSPSKKEITELKNTANIIGMFVTEMRLAETNEISRNAAFSIVNALNSYAYVINSETYEILFLNDKTKNWIQGARAGAICYKILWQRERPCKKCPMKKLMEEGTEQSTLEIFNSRLEIWLKSSASWVQWTDGNKNCLIDSADISKYQKT